MNVALKRTGQRKASYLPTGTWFLDPEGDIYIVLAGSKTVCCITQCTADPADRVEVSEVLPPGTELVIQEPE